jgi:hypothetical protein
MAPSIASLSPIACATRANEPACCGIVSRIVKLYDAEG